MMDKALQLGDEIIAMLRQGMKLGPDVIHFIDSTFGTFSTERLEALLQDESDSGAESLIDLIFFPDAAFQARVEDLLEGSAFEEDDERCIQERLCTCRLETILHLPEGLGFLAVVLPPDAAVRLVRRLHISRTPDPSIVEALNEFIDLPLRRLCKVRLRQSRFSYTPAINWFLAKLFKAMGPGNAELVDRLDFLCHFFEDMSGACDPFDALAARKRFYIRQLFRLEAVESQIAGKNMETLIQQGFRTPYLDKDLVRKKIRWIDEICLAVFNKTDYFFKTIDP